MLKYCTLFAALLSGAAIAPHATAADIWPQFRGPLGNGHAEASDLPTKFSDADGKQENIAWKTGIHGKAWSSPVVWGEQIWLTTAPADGKAMYAVCVDLNSGKILHDLKLWDVEKPQFCIDMNSYASCTPVIEEGRVYVHFGAHGTAAIDTATGQIIWSRLDLECNHHRGPASSPIVQGDLLILTFDGFDVQYLVALDKHTGRTVWKRDRNIDYGSDNGDVKKAYSTPHVIDVDGKLQLVSPSAGATISYDPLTGEELWRVRSGGMNAAARPLFGHGLVYCTSAAGGWQLFAVKPGGSGDVSGSHVAWKSSKGIPTRPSLLLAGDLLYMVSDAGIMTCLDAKTGEPVWQERFGGKFSASPLLADGKIYFFDEGGQVAVVEPAREYKLLATNQLPTGCMASPAVVGQALIVRTKTHLYRIEKKN